MKSRTIGAIVLGPRRIQGQYNYMSLETGEKIDGRVVVILPITDDVINDRLSKGEPPLERQYARPESYTFAEVWRRWWSKWDVEGRRFDANEIDMLPLALKKSPGKEFLYLKPGSSCRRGTG